MSPKDVTIFTRGVSTSCGTGGYAVVLSCDGKTRELVGAHPASSNNRMDIVAAIEGLKALKQPCMVTIVNNNTYLVDAIAKGWAAKWRTRGWRNAEDQPAPHAELWQTLLELCAVHDVSFVYRALGGASTELLRCDQLAHAAARAQGLE